MRDNEKEEIDDESYDVEFDDDFIQETISDNVVWDESRITREDRELKNLHGAMVVWLTGLSGSGKSTIANGVEKFLFKRGYQVFKLDGDNVRHGLNGDLGFSDEDRTENIRRIGHLSNLFYEAGQIVLCSFISPFKKDRQFVRELFPEGKFLEVFVKADLDTCRGRDPKGLYDKAISGEIKEFTGISSPYEEPETPDLVIDTNNISRIKAIRQLAVFIIKKSTLTGRRRLRERQRKNLMSQE